MIWVRWTMVWRKWVRWTMVWKKFKWNVINEVDTVTREELRSSDYVVMCCEHPPWPRGRNVANCAVDLYSFNKSITDEIRFFPIDSMQISDNIIFLHLRQLFPDQPSWKTTYFDVLTSRSALNLTGM